MRHTILTTLAALCLLALRAEATVLIPADLSELARDAQVIARGAVVAVDARWTDDRRTIETVVTLAPEHYLKGELGDTVQFRVPGGRLGRLRNVVMGAPQFAVGQRVIVFLGTDGPRVPHIIGLNQGVYRVNASASGAAMVSPPPVMPGVTGPVVRGAVDRVPAPLADFERDVRTLAGLR
ncbi:MAG: hypothetical protein U0Q11_07195 [Vicinamibacterales bacterium]